VPESPIRKVEGEKESLKLALAAGGEGKVEENGVQDQNRGQTDLSRLS
jgi:hypothetical protein